MSTVNLLAGLLLAAGMSVDAGLHASELGLEATNQEVAAAKVRGVPAFSIDEYGVLHGQDVSDESQAPFNWNCVC
jgi:hypothetical protein